MAMREGPKTFGLRALREPTGGRQGQRCGANRPIPKRGGNGMRRSVGLKIVNGRSSTNARCVSDSDEFAARRVRQKANPRRLRRGRGAGMALGLGSMLQVWRQAPRSNPRPGGRTWQPTIRIDFRQR